MDDRRQAEARDDRSQGEQETGRYGQGQTNEMTQSRERREADGGGSTGARSGDWQGYVVPYRYYGPGYRGVGYYSIMYQGSGAGSGSQQGYGDDAQWSQSGAGRDRSGTQGWQGGPRGGFAGRGPKGYQRSDERLRDEISDRLMEDDTVDASDIEIRVSSGEVTLAGTVPDRWMKRQAEDCAEQVMGVREVMNQLRVRSDVGTSQQAGMTKQDGSKAQPESMRTTQPGDQETTDPNGSRRTATSATR